MYWKRPKTFSSKMKKENFIEVYAKKKKEIPAPSAYNLESKSMWSGLYRDCSGHSGRWLKCPKTTYIDDILKQKKLKLPGPCTYKIPEYKMKNWPMSKTEKGEFIDNCRWFGKQTPGHQYKINYDAIRPKTPAARYIVKKDESGNPIRHETSIKFKKTKDPAPGSYNYPEAYAYSYLPKKEFMIPKETGKSFIGKIKFPCLKFY
jgi:hypothetical protein